jgi:DNA-binding transcriptional LysR family regulator
MKLPFNLRDLHFFVVAAEEGQMTRAAARLGVAQPALSQGIARLEERVGTSLLERRARGVWLTPAGEAFFERARAVVSATEEAICAVAPWARGEERISLGFPPSLQGLARPLRRRFMERHPGVEMEVRHLEASERLTALRTGRIDAELLYPAPPPGDGLVTHTVLTSPRYAVLSEHHRLAGEGRLCFEQIAGETFPGRHPGRSPAWASATWLPDRAGCDPPPTAETPLGLDQLWALIYSGRAIAVLPGFMLSATVGDGVQAVPLRDVDPLEVVLARREADRRHVVDDLFELARESPETGSHVRALSRPRVRHVDRPIPAQLT